MKKYSFLVGFSFIFSLVLFSQSTQKAEQFTSLSISGNINVTILPTTGEAKVEYEIIKGDKEDFKIEVKENTLRLKAGSMWGKSRTKVKATVYYNEMNSISASAGSSLKNSSLLNTDFFSLSASSGANVDLILNCNSTDISASSGTSISLTGKGGVGSITASSGASVNARDLILSEASVTSSSGASISIHVTNSLTANASSGGSISYKGEPKSVTKNRSVSGGSVSKM
jgi:hypothetical protein